MDRSSLLRDSSIMDCWLLGYNYSKPQNYAFIRTILYQCFTARLSFLIQQQYCLVFSFCLGLDCIQKGKETNFSHNIPTETLLCSTSFILKFLPTCSSSPPLLLLHSVHVFVSLMIPQLRGHHGAPNGLTLDTYHGFSSLAYAHCSLLRQLWRTLTWNLQGYIDHSLNS